MTDDISFICSCGRRFIVPAGRYTCSTCGTTHWHGISKSEFEKNKRARRVLETVGKRKKIIAAIKKRSFENEKVGDAVARFEELAIKFRSRLASDLTQIIHACGCSRDVAIAELNKQGWPL